ncbi:MAG: hypothetical protein AUK31_03385 [Fibrobacteres bacterium CG2_30_45_31]|nr:MAG: hypothetical protein AUK31_03385 [Fibrobacteres bacterium CG2_30_45_31]
MLLPSVVLICTACTVENVVNRCLRWALNIFEADSEMRMNFMCLPTFSLIKIQNQVFNLCRRFMWA